MKIPVHVTVEKEIEVEISTEDIAAEIGGVADCSRDILQGLNNFSRFIRPAPQRFIDELTVEQRELIHTFFIEQAERFKASA